MAQLISSKYVTEKDKKAEEGFCGVWCSTNQTSGVQLSR